MMINESIFFNPNISRMQVGGLLVSKVVGLAARKAVLLHNDARVLSRTLRAVEPNH